MNDRRLYQIILGSRTTEKSVTAAEKFGHITFRVASDATKTEVRQAIEKLFNVVVEKVQIINVKSKTKRFRQAIGKQSSWKKAIVALREGHDINLAEYNEA